MNSKGDLNNQGKVPGAIGSRVQNLNNKSEPPGFTIPKKITQFNQDSLEDRLVLSILGFEALDSGKSQDLIQLWEDSSSKQKESYYMLARRLLAECIDQRIDELSKEKQYELWSKACAFGLKTELDDFAAAQTKDIHALIDAVQRDLRETIKKSTSLSSTIGLAIIGALSVSFLSALMNFIDKYR